MAATFQIICSALIFVLLWRFLGHGVFKPFFAMLEERESRTVGARNSAVKTLTDVDAVERRIEAALLDARAQGVKLHDEHVQTAKSQAQSIIEKAQEEAQERIEAVREELAEKLRIALAGTGEQIEELSVMLVERALAESDLSSSVAQGRALH